MKLWPFAAPARRRSTDVTTRHDAAPAWTAGPVAGQTEALEERLLLFVTFGTKWGDPTFGTGAEVTYSFVTESVANVIETGTGNVTNVWETLNLDEQGVRDAVARSFNRWASVSGVSFTEVLDDGADVGAATSGGDIRIGVHTFEANGAIAHGFFPPADGEGLTNSITGDIHFNPEFTYSLEPIGSNPAGTIRFENTFIHEVGHTLGLGHTDVEDGMNIMQQGGTRPRDFDDLGQDDIAGIQAIYGAAATDGVGFITLQGGGTLIDSNGTALAVTGSDVVTVLNGAANFTGYEVFFDGSDVGLASQINSVSYTINGELLMTFATPTVLDGVAFGTEDVARFNFLGGTLFGPSTQGVFDMYFDGSDLGLVPSTTIDGLSVDASGNLFLSFGPGGSVGGEDIAFFNATSLGPNTSGTLSLAVDFSDVGLQGAPENVDALSVAGSNYYFSTTGTFVTPDGNGNQGLAGTQSDIGIFTVTQTGDTTTGTFNPTLFIDAADRNLNPVNVNGFHLGPVPTSANPGPTTTTVFRPPFGIFPAPPGTTTTTRPGLPFGPVAPVDPIFPQFPPTLPAPIDPGPIRTAPPTFNTSPFSPPLAPAPPVFGFTPPVSTPPAVSPPAYTPPVYTPPAATPSPFTPPVVTRPTGYSHGTLTYYSSPTYAFTPTIYSSTPPVSSSSPPVWEDNTYSFDSYESESYDSGSYELDSPGSESYGSSSYESESYDSGSYDSYGSESYGSYGNSYAATNEMFSGSSFWMDY